MNKAEEFLKVKKIPLLVFPYIRNDTLTTDINDKIGINLVELLQEYADSQWNDFLDQEPTRKDLPFITQDTDGLYDVWDDSDWFDEILDERSQYTYWKHINPPK